MGTSGELSLEDRKLELEREKVALEKQKLELEREKVKWSAITAVVPICVALGTIFYGVWSLSATAESQFETKVAELALAAPDGGQAKARAQVIAILFQDLLPKDFTRRLEHFDATPYTDRSPGIVSSKKELFTAIAEHPTQRAQLLSTWKALFPDDKWIEDLK